MCMCMHPDWLGYCRPEIEILSAELKERAGALQKSGLLSRVEQFVKWGTEELCWAGLCDAGKTEELRLLQASFRDQQSKLFKKYGPETISVLR